MKFKALFAGVLIGAIALSSCVKNVESPEVTALRNARADEIRALAEYHRAEAAAATTLANAQAALDQAQAAYIAAQTQTEQANAASAKAQAELLQTAIDKWREEELAKINENPSMCIQSNTTNS